MRLLTSHTCALDLHVRYISAHMMISESRSLSSPFSHQCICCLVHQSKRIHQYLIQRPFSGRRVRPPARSLARWLAGWLCRSFTHVFYHKGETISITRTEEICPVFPPANERRPARRILAFSRGNFQQSMHSRDALQPSASNDRAGQRF